MQMSSQVYDILKYIGSIVLPALSVLVVSIGDAIGFDADMISKIIMALDVFLNALLQQSTASYYKAKAEVSSIQQEM